MPYISTQGRTPPTTLPEALFQGLAPDGGLFMPTTIPTLSPGDLAVFGEMDWVDTGFSVLRRLFAGELTPGQTEGLVRDAFNFPLPLYHLSERIVVLDLSKGPTLAFKDVGARFMARLMAHFREEKGEPLTILTATSGDTGGAVADAFLGLPGVRVVVLFPDGKISLRQERQFSTLGQNVYTLAVQGDFDDCQRLAKEAFRDDDLRRTISLTSANSINIGRFLPQTVYFIYAWTKIQGGGSNTPVLFSVPSGNFGNLAAGLLAKAMGLPDVDFLAATNANDGVPRFLTTGVFEPRPSKQTLSTAMDVGNPSNLARILHLYGGAVEQLKQDLAGISISDEETAATIRRVKETTGRVLDPHTAVGYAALEEGLQERPGATGILLATAAPSKFAEVVEPILGETLPIPPELARGLEGSRKITRIDPSATALRGFLLDPDR